MSRIDEAYKALEDSYEYNAPNSTVLKSIAISLVGILECMENLIDLEVKKLIDKEYTIHMPE